ncbi:chorismate--pyruvate lyase family protein [Nocardia brasiliensis]
MELAMPPIARMILHADGSTTRLLEALLGQPLSLSLQEQQAGLAAAVAPEVRFALGCAATDEIMYRRSQLCSSAGAVVSSNEVTVVCRDPGITALLTHCGTPIGHALTAAGRQLPRVLPASGRSARPDDLQRCVYKEYLFLDAAGDPIAHFRERFNPVYVPSVENRTHTAETVGAVCVPEMCNAPSR